ncbi:MAG: hypothetical protein EA421_01330 [Gemmatimonadales bacterium]|nr:MAG: hypothetical protein EA421_01330 [Gemmatimonadales bacterium]
MLVLMGPGTHHRMRRFLVGQARGSAQRFGKGPKGRDVGRFLRVQGLSQYPLLPPREALPGFPGTRAEEAGRTSNPAPPLIAPLAPG